MGGGRNPLNLQTECSHDGFPKRLICFEASLRGSKKRVVGLQPPSFGNRMLERLKEGGGGLGGVRIPQICKQNARMMGFKRLMCGEASLHASKKKGDPICSLFLVKGGGKASIFAIFSRKNLYVLYSIIARTPVFLDCLFVFIGIFRGTQGKKVGIERKNDRTKQRRK